MTVFSFSFLLSAISLIFVLFAIYKKRLELKFSLFWIFSCIGMMVISLNHNLLDKISELLNVSYPPSLLFLSGFLFTLGVVFQLTQVITKLDKKLTRLTQEFSILEEKIKKRI